jgi:hypothetical protein
VLCAKRNCGLIRKKDGGQQQRRWRRKGIGRRLNECERSAEMDDNVGWENVKMRRKNRNGDGEGWCICLQHDTTKQPNNAVQCSACFAQEQHSTAITDKVESLKRNGIVGNNKAH